MAIKIQRWFKNRKFRLFCSLVLKMKTKAAVTIQRVLRQTILRPNEESFTIIDNKLEYFESLKHKLLTDCQIKIAYSWRKYIKKKRIRLAKEAAAKAKRLAAKKGKTSKKGKKGKKKSATMQPKESKEITITKDRKCESSLEPGSE